MRESPAQALDAQRCFKQQKPCQSCQIQKSHCHHTHSKKAKEMGGKKLAREHASPGFEEATYMGIIGKGKQGFMQQQQQ
jgi:hypothetical protein